MNRWTASLFGLMSALPILISIHMARGAATLFTIMAAAALGLHFWPRRFPLAVARPYLLLMAALCLWAVLSALWAYDLRADGLGALRLCAMMAGGLVLVSLARRLNPDEARRFRRFFVLAYAAIAGLIAFDLLSGMQVMRLTYAWRGMTVPASFTFVHDTKHRAILMAILMAPAFLAAKREWGLRAALPLAAVASLLVVAHRSETALLALAGGMIAAPLSFWRPKATLWAGLAGLVLLFLLPPFLPGNLPTAQEFGQAHPEVSTSLRHRLAIWEYALNRVTERPILGHGFDAAREIGGREPKRMIELGTIHGVPYQPYFEPIPLHTHNGVIQLWLELGAVGALIGGLLLTLLWRRIHTLADPWERAGRTALFVAVMAPVLSSYGLFQAWWVGTLWLAIAALEAENAA